MYDTQYEYKTVEARVAGGKLFWNDWTDEGSKQQELKTMTSPDIVRRMDFPLVSIVMSYDGYWPPISDAIQKFKEAFPVVARTLGALGSRDAREPESWKPNATGQLPRRHGTMTREGYQGTRLAKKLAYYLMDEAR